VLDAAQQAQHSKGFSVGTLRAFSATPMNRRRLILAFLVYVTLDLSNPFVPGAFNFNPDECVEAIQRVSSSHQRIDASALPARVPVMRLELPASSPARPPVGGRYVILEWLVDSREDARASGDPRPPGEAH
jgi:hypothetical protein